MPDEALIREVLKRVLAEMGQAAPSAAPCANPAQARPDGPSQSAAAKNARKVFVTAETLAARIKAGQGAVLGEGEILTPNAQDYADQHHLQVQKVSVPALRRGGNEPALPDTSAIGIVTFQESAAVQTALAATARGGVGLPRYDGTDCWTRNTSAMLKDIAAARIDAGIILVPAAEAAIVFANKYRGIRAIPAGSVDGVTSAVSELDANVLVVDHARRSFHEIRLLLQAFLAERRRPRKSGSLLAAINHVEGQA